MQPEQSEELRSPDSAPNGLRRIGVLIGAIFTAVLIVVLVGDWLWSVIIDSDLLDQSRGLGPRPERPRHPLAQQLIAVLLCLTGTVLLGRVQREDPWPPVVLFGWAGLITLWASAVGVQQAFRVSHLVIGLGCFGLAALAYRVGSQS